MNLHIKPVDNGHALEHNGRLLRPIQLTGYDPFNTGYDLYVYLAGQDGTAGVLHPARPLLTHLLENEFRDPPPPMPPAVPWPSTYQSLDADVQQFLLRAAEGYDTLPDGMTQARLLEVQWQLKENHIRPLRVTGCTNLIDAIAAAKAEARRHIAGNTAISTQPRTPRRSMHIDDVTQGLALPIREATPEELETARLKRYRQWPFINMKEGQSVVIPAELGVAGQNAAHAIGSLKGWKFRTRRAVHNREMIVTRVK